jgi:hypothetical protein
MSTPSDDSALSLWTIGSIAIVAYCFANVLHEGLGHGGACLLMGGRPQTLNAIFFAYDTGTVSPAGNRFIAGGGPIVNLINGGIALLLLRLWKPLADSARYFMWLFSAVNFLMAFGYVLFSGVAGVGDWMGVVGGLASPVTVRLGLALIGAFLYFFVAPRLLMPGFMNFLNRDYAAGPQIRRLVRFPYLIGGTTFLLAGLLNPYGLNLVLTSAVAASFGGASLLAWYPMSRTAPSSSKTLENPLVLKTSRGWMIAAAITLVIFMGFLGRGMNF